MAQSQTVGLTIRIAFPQREAKQVQVNGKYVPMNQWDDSQKNYGPIRQRFCGENRFIGVKNILEFYLSSGCELRISPRSAVQTMLRMKWTMREYFADGGSTRFISRLSKSLNLSSSAINVVSVYSGSVVINYEIEAESSEELEKI